MSSRFFQKLQGEMTSGDLFWRNVVRVGVELGDAVEELKKHVNEGLKFDLSRLESAIAGYSVLVNVSLQHGFISTDGNENKKAALNNCDAMIVEVGRLVGTLVDKHLVVPSEEARYFFRYILSTTEAAASRLAEVTGVDALENQQNTAEV